MSANDVADDLVNPCMRTKIYYAAYLIALILATIGWLGLLAWLAMAFVGG